MHDGRCEEVQVRVLVCPDKFAGTLDAGRAARAIASGWRSAAAADEVIVRPLSDGGPGFLQVLASALGGTRVPVPTCDPLGRPVPGWMLLAGSRAYLESAQACGLHLLATTERDPRRTTSSGLGLLVAAAVEAGVAEVVIGLGGTATNDAGAGMLAALGAAPVDAAGYALPYGGAALAACAGLGGVPALRGTRLVGATDVDSPLTGPTGASVGYGPQKGADPAAVIQLDAALGRCGQVLVGLPGCPPDVAGRPGAGAAGGLGAAILACGGQLRPGYRLVAELTGFDRELDQADLVITGEGSVDRQSLRGKVVSGVAAVARERGVPCLVLAGRLQLSRLDSTQAGFTQVETLVGYFGSEQRAHQEAAAGLSALARILATRWSPTSSGLGGTDGNGGGYG
jgi:glycerate kinase